VTDTQISTLIANYEESLVAREHARKLTTKKIRDLGKAVDELTAALRSSKANGYDTETMEHAPVAEALQKVQLAMTAAKEASAWDHELTEKVLADLDVLERAKRERTAYDALAGSGM
jgi:translation elongation factor EF-1beta